MKKQLVDFLKSISNDLESGSDMWYAAKEYFKNKGIEMGGSYASFSNMIVVRTLVDGKMSRFQVELSDVK